MQSNEGFLTIEEGVKLYFGKIGEGSRSIVFPNGMYLIQDFERLACAGRRLVFYDVRNRGKSDAVDDPAKLQRGILNDVDDLEAVRKHFGIEKLDVIGHSYMGEMVALYAMKYPENTNRVVQIGAAEPEQGKEYPEHLRWHDAARAAILGRIPQMIRHSSGDASENCRKFWAVLRDLYVVDPANAHRTDWSRCNLANELNFMSYWTGYIFPSLRKLNLTAQDFAQAQSPVLTIHGRKDRSAPYGGGREWALRLPNARLVTVEEAGHAPWVENPEKVFGAIERFLSGEWPESAEKVESL